LNPLYLSGWGVKVRVSNIESLSELEVVDGRGGNTYAFRPRQIPFDSIIIHGHSGYISLQAFHWLSRNDIPVFVMNYDGNIISSLLPPTTIKADLRSAQFQTANDQKKKLTIARSLVQAKFVRSLQVLDWLAERYDIEREVLRVRKEAMKLLKASSTVQVRTVEAHVAQRYWEAFRKTLPEPLGFHGRLTTTTNKHASDPVNLALNYGYGFLEAECRMAINIVGLEIGVGFLHDSADYQTKQALVYDLQEPFRFLVDVTVRKAFESGALDAKSFYFVEQDYRFSFELDAKGRFLNLLREQFNSGVKYKGRVLKWDTVIQQKANELARYLTGRSSTVDFSEPAPVLERSDSSMIREKILSLTQSEAEKRGIGKSELHYLRRKARDQHSFKIYGKVAELLHDFRDYQMVIHDSTDGNSNPTPHSLKGNHDPKDTDRNSYRPANLTPSYALHLHHPNGAALNLKRQHPNIEHT
jgi:CRISPR-associated protein Cas1